MRSWQAGDTVIVSDADGHQVGRFELFALDAQEKLAALIDQCGGAVSLSDEDALPVSDLGGEAA